jgi:hypothetical protein
MSKQTISNVIKNIAPAIVVLAAGLTGAYMVYDSYFSDEKTVYYSSMAPAAGIVNGADESEISIKAAVAVGEPSTQDCASAAKAIDSGTVVEDDIIAIHAACIETAAGTPANDNNGGTDTTDIFAE